MSNLTEALARWDDMTAAECNALVAVHIMGWELLEEVDYDKNDCWEVWLEGGGGVQDGLPIRSTDKDREWELGTLKAWNPTTDRNDCAEAVEAFEKAGIGTAFFENKLKKIMLDRGQDVRCMGAADWILSAPKDVCRAMIKARAKGAK